METAVETTMLHFTIEGEFLTNFIRGVWVEGRLKYALELLDSSNCPKEWWLPILTGKAKMVGENELHIEEDNVESLYGISLQVEALVPRLEDQLIRAKADLIAAEERLSYWPLRMDIEGVRYKTGKMGWMDNYSAPIDEALSRVRGEEVIQLSPLFDFVYPLVGKTMKDFPEHRVIQLIKNEYIDYEHPRYLPNMRKEAYKPLTVKGVFEKEVEEENKLMGAEVIETVVDDYENGKVIKKQFKFPEAIKNYPGVDFKILKNPWEGEEGISKEIEDHSLTKPIPWNIGSGVEYIQNEVRHFVKDPKAPREVFLEITSWRGISPEAIHYYGKLHFWGLSVIEEGKEDSGYSTSYFGKELKSIQSTDVKLTRLVTKRDLKMDKGRTFEGFRLNSHTNRFDTKKDVIKRGKEIFQKFFGEGWKLKVEDNS